MPTPCPQPWPVNMKSAPEPAETPQDEDAAEDGTAVDDAADDHAEGAGKALEAEPAS